MSKLIQPLYITQLDEAFDISQGSPANDACVNISNIIKDHQNLFGLDIKKLYPDDESMIQIWPSISTEWVGSKTTIMNMGKRVQRDDGTFTGCTYREDVTVNVWYYRDEISKGMNNKKVRLICDIISKIILSHRTINGLCTAEEAQIIDKGVSARVRENHVFDAGFVGILVPIRVCEVLDPSKGATLCS